MKTWLERLWSWLNPQSSATKEQKEKEEREEERDERERLERRRGTKRGETDGYRDVR